MGRFNLFLFVIPAALSAFLVGCVATHFSVNETHVPRLQTLHVGDAAVAEKEHAEVTLVEFSSLTRAEGKKVHLWLLEEEISDGLSIRRVFKHWVAGTGQAGMRAAKASIAAQTQNKFWEFSALLAKETKSLTDSRLFEIAQSLGLDMKRFERDMGDPLTKTRIDADTGYGEKLGLGKGSSLFVNGRRLASPISKERFVEVLQEETKKAKRLIGLGVPSTFVPALLTDLNRTESRKPLQSTAPKREDPVAFFPVSYSNAHLALGAPEKDALVTLVVFNDYQCTFCRRHEGTLAALLQAFPKTLRILIRHNALPRHTHAKAAASASLAAVEMGIGVKYHQGLFAQPNELHRGGLLRLAADLGADPSLFEAAMLRHVPLVEQDTQDAKNAGAKGTPHTFINGRKIRGAQSPSVFLKAVQLEMEKARRTQKESGLSGKALYNKIIGIPE